MRRILLLPAYEHVYRDIIYFNEEKTFMFFKLYDKELLFSVNIRVQAGINLEKGFSLDNDGTHSIRITLPEPEILLIDADETTIKELFITEWGKEINRLDYYSEIENKKEAVAADAVKRGILVKAAQNIDFMLTNLFKSAGYDSVTIIFEGQDNEEEKTPVD